MPRAISRHAVLEIGTRFEKLVTIGDPYQVFGHKRAVTWDVMVRCDCGVEKAARVWQLKRGKAKSCGCHSRRIHSRIVFTKGFRTSKGE